MVEANEILDLESRWRQGAFRRYPHRYLVVEAVATLEPTATHAEHLRVPTLAGRYIQRPRAGRAGLEREASRQKLITQRKRSP